MSWRREPYIVRIELPVESFALRSEIRIALQQLLGGCRWWRRWL